MRIKLTIFDYDNTLVDAMRSFYNSFIASLLFYGLEPISYQEVLNHFSNNTLERILPVHVDREAFWETFLRAYELASYIPEVSPQVFSVLESLRSRGITLAIITGRKESIGRFMDEPKKARSARYFDYICRAGAVYVINELKDLLAFFDDSRPFRCEA